MHVPPPMSPNFAKMVAPRHLSLILITFILFVISLDDKDRIKVGPLPVAKQKKGIMAVERSRTAGDDHDFVKASSYKIISFVHQMLDITDNCCGAAGAVSNRGGINIVLRSGKHDSSTSTSHSVDIHDVFNHSDFKESSLDKYGNLKPVHVYGSDGGPDECIRFTKTSICHVVTFITWNLEALFART